MAKDADGLHLQTEQEFAAQLAAMLDDLDGAAE